MGWFDCLGRSKVSQDAGKGKGHDDHHTKIQHDGHGHNTRTHEHHATQHPEDFSRDEKDGDSDSKSSLGKQARHLGIDAAAHKAGLDEKNTKIAHEAGNLAYEAFRHHKIKPGTGPTEKKVKATPHKQESHITSKHQRPEPSHHPVAHNKDPHGRYGHKPQKEKHRH
jgi:hypothetical protein